MFKEGKKELKDILGGKGANLCEMTRMKLPIPNGFIITIDDCKDYYINNKIPDELIKDIEIYLKKLRKKSLRKNKPLLVSVRSGSRVSMPGMMDTILNIGMNDEIVNSFDNKRFAYDSYRRLIMMFSDVVMGLDRKLFEDIIDKYKNKKNIKYDIDLNEEDLINITSDFKELYKSLTKEEFPQDIKVQLIRSTEAVFKSWNNERAKYYRKINNISDDYMTAVNIQEMVYGNYNDKSLTGVCFSRNPSDGNNTLYGEFLINAQGEDIVSGSRTPNDINNLKEVNENIYNELYKYSKILENHYRDMQDIEFTVEDNKLFILQTRTGKRTCLASIKIALDMIKEKLITKEEAILRVDSKSLDQLMHDSFDDSKVDKDNIIAKGIPASPGCAYGKVYFNSSDIINSKEKNTILVREETLAEDIIGMKNSNGILTIRGGMTSHAAVVARSIGKCCVSGANISIKNNSIVLDNKKVIKEGEYISIDGNTGMIYKGIIPTKSFSISKEVEEFFDYVDEYRKIGVKCNADTKIDAEIGKRFSAEGIGLCRTEHMFFDKERLLNLRKMIITNDNDKYLNKLLEYQRNDFEEIFKVMNHYPVIIRYLDPPLHEFLPSTKEEIKELSNSLNLKEKELKEKIDELKEFNPMMGHRGVRLLITYENIVKMQTKAVIEAAINVLKEGFKVSPKIMIPLINDTEEFIYIKNIIDNEAKKVMDEKNKIIDYTIGSMIETPRAALLSEDISKYADFYSIGSNDLTQLTYGISRDDSSFLKDYYDKGIYKYDPFKILDNQGVGRLIKLTCIKARENNSNFEIGICGEQAVSYETIEYLRKIGINYVSVSPYRILEAKLNAAKVEINRGK